MFIRRQPRSPGLTSLSSSPHSPHRSIPHTSYPILQTLQLQPSEIVYFSSNITSSFYNMPFQTPPPATTIFEVSFPSPGVLLATINREKRMNSIPLRGHHEGTALWDWMDNEPSMRVGIITGKGPKAFCAGADLIEQRDISRGDEARPEKGAEGGFAGLSQRRGKKPVIAAVNGLALGGGFEICLNWLVHLLIVATVLESIGSFANQYSNLCPVT